MVTLSAATSVFQLAVGVNAVMPVLLSDLERARFDVAESLLRKLKENFPNFEVKDRDRHFFITFTSASIRGFKYKGLGTGEFLPSTSLLPGINCGALLGFHHTEPNYSPESIPCFRRCNAHCCARHLRHYDAIAEMALPASRDHRK